MTTSQRLPRGVHDVERLSQLVLQGHERALARVMRLLDDGHVAGLEILKRLYPSTGRAKILGITGNPGAGKSTLTEQLIGAFRQRGQRVGVIAVDPSSPFSGGAILGDRIRMNRYATDPGVFIRSQATRGHLGGLSRSTNDLIHVLDAGGYDRILVETVGVGQDEIEIMTVADTVVVVLVPGLGDDIQAIKAGLLEIADLFVVNKADRDGADHTVRDLRQLQALHHKSTGWTPPIIKTVATRGDGLPELLLALDAHEEALASAGAGNQRSVARASHTLVELLSDGLRKRALGLLTTHRLAELSRRIARRETDPYTEAERILCEALPQVSHEPRH